MKRRTPASARLALSLSTVRQLSGRHLARVGGGDCDEPDWVVPATVVNCGRKPEPTDDCGKTSACPGNTGDPGEKV